MLRDRHEAHLTSVHFRNNTLDDDMLDGYLSYFEHVRDEIPKKIPVALDSLPDATQAQECVECGDVTTQQINKCPTRVGTSGPRCNGKLEKAMVQKLGHCPGLKRKRVAVGRVTFAEDDDKLLEEALELNEFEKDEIPHNDIANRDDNGYQKAMCWPNHFNRVRHPEVRKKWEEILDTDPLVEAHDSFMKNVYAYTKRGDTRRARFAANRRNNDDLTVGNAGREKPVAVPEGRDKYLASFQFIFKFLISSPGMFMFTPFQRQCFQNMKANPTCDHVAAFWTSLLCHPIIDGEEYHPLVAALAAFSYESNKGRYKEPHNATSPIAQVVLNCQLLLIYVARQFRFDSNPTLAFTVTFLPFVSLAPFEDNYSFLDWIMRNQSLGRSLSKTYNSQDCGAFNPATGVVSYSDVQTTEMNIRTGIHEMVSKAEDDLAKILQVKDLPDIDPANFTDCSQSRGVGKTFADEPGNGFVLSTHFKPGPVKYMFNNWRHLVVSSGRPYERGCKSFFKMVVEFKEYLLACIHFTQGGPARVPELLTAAMAETPTSLKSFDFDAFGCGIVYRYNKTSWTANTRSIYRYLPRRVGMLVAIFIGVVMPFVRLLNRMLKKASRGYTDQTPIRQSSYLFQPRSCKDNEIDKVDLMDIWDESRGQRVIKKLATRHMKSEMNVKAWRHIYSMLFRSPSMLKSIKAAETQLGHSAQTGARIYGREEDVDAGSSTTARDTDRQSSINWHNYIGLGIDIILDDEADQAVATRLTLFRKVDWLTQLRLFYRDNTKEFKTDQLDNLKAISKRHGEVVIVMPTGAGKSLLFMLPAFIHGPKHVTVVVSPLNAIINDMLEKCLTIQAAKWDPSNPRFDLALVFVTPESFVSDKFQRYLGTRQSQGTLHNIVFDECHTVLCNGLGQPWRPSLHKLAGLLRFKAQIVYLTATLPMSLESTFRERLSLVNPEIRRSGTARPALRYERDSSTKVHKAMKRYCEDHEYRDSITMIFVFSKITVASVAEELATLRVRCHTYHAEMPEAEKAAVLSDLRTGVVKIVVTTTALSMGVDLPNVGQVLHYTNKGTLVEYAQETGRASRSGVRGRCVLFNKAIKPTDDELDDSRADYANTTQCLRLVMSRYLDGHGQTCDSLVGCIPCQVCCPQLDRLPYEERPDDLMNEAFTRERSSAILIPHFRNAEIYSLYRKKLDEICVVCFATDRYCPHGCDIEAKSRTTFMREYYLPVLDAFKKDRQDDPYPYENGKACGHFKKYVSCFWCGRPFQDCESRARKKTQCLQIKRYQCLRIVDKLLTEPRLAAVLKKVKTVFKELTPHELPSSLPKSFEGVSKFAVGVNFGPHECSPWYAAALLTLHYWAVEVENTRV